MYPVWNKYVLNEHDQFQQKAPQAFIILMISEEFNAHNRSA